MPMEQFGQDFWSQPSSMQGSQSASASAGGSVPSFPFQGQFGAGDRSGAAGFPDYNAYLQSLRGADPSSGWRFQTGWNPRMGWNQVPGQAPSWGVTNAPVSREQFTQMQTGRQIGTGETLRGAGTTPELEQYRARLSSLLGDPSQIANDPSYQFLLSQGEGALSRRLNASRMGDSGRALLEAQNFGQQTASQYLNSLAERYRGAIGTEVGAMAPRLRAEEDIFNTFWRNAPVSFQSAGSTSQSLGFGG